jgi:uncharacterized repeat protein (TIGR03837 family)
MATSLTWDIFCRVVDNFGDAGVCWRLARQLAAEHGACVRLWIDDLQSLNRLSPAVATSLATQEVDGVRVCRWTEPLRAGAPARIVIEAFGCGLPDEYVSAMAAAENAPVWVVLEYLSAEAWVSEHHGLPSPHPRWPLERHFFFPGFVEGTGGLLRDGDLFDRRERFDTRSRELLWRSLGHSLPPDGAVTVSIFAYESAPVQGLLHCWEQGTTPTVAAIPDGSALPAVLRHFGAEAAPANRVLRRGALEARIVPFMPQPRYDEFLWACDFNFVRGEDSFVRAQWAAHPFVWHVYPQPDRAHTAKLDAFLALYTETLPTGARIAVGDLMRVWNQIEVAGVTPASAWTAYAAEAAVLQHHAAAWAQRAAATGGLATNLARFCSSKLK